MSTETKTAPPKQKLSAADVAKIPRVLLFDENKRWWGYVTSDDAATLKRRSPSEWYALGRQLLAEYPDSNAKLIVIPYEEKGGGNRSRLFLTPWSDQPVSPPEFTPEEIAKLEAMSTERSQMLSFDEFKESVIQVVQESDREIGQK